MKSWREKNIHGQILRQLQEDGVYIKGRWNPELKLQSVVICAAQEVWGGVGGQFPTDLN